MELTKGVKMLFTVFIVFTVCYVTRTIYDLCVDPTLDFANLFSGVVLPILWDWVPILLMFTYHYNNMKNTKNKNLLGSNSTSGKSRSRNTTQEYGLSSQHNTTQPLM